MISPLRRRKLIFSYLPDWIITIVLAAIFFSLDKVEGYRREFSVSDTSLRHTHAVHERVPNWALYIICFVAPFLIMPVVNLLTIRSWWDFHNGSLGLILGLALTGSITQFTKITVGRPRPDLIDRCQPINGSVDPTYGLSTDAICTRTDLLNDGFRSFPSGHSSMSFAGLGFLAYYLAGKLHLFDERGHAGKAWLALTPFAGAALVAISRTMDYRHHWQDVLVGSILGTVMSYFSYRQYYPDLASELSHRPYSPRIKREDDRHEGVLPLHHRSPSGLSENHSQIANGRPGHSMVRRYTDEPIPVDDANYELEGTVRRPDPGSLEEIWRDGEPEHGRVGSSSRDASQP
ncbi:PAP2-domain-containing protein [Dendrothele bispora CBS 962.96]|uniref:PAP2-domain-containing protein n=1 Tax=Dendrothele bispora (strain CBS 962.96) TaxID=1314807 RepID=A0A4S8LRX8_DENBC|nr:PAP2-domain-containing protein [Dendrothele bispora CBS 962.96]